MQKREIPALIAALGILLLAFAAPALAAPQAHDAPEGHEEGGPNIFAGDLGNVVWTLIIFFLVVTILGKFAWGPLLDNLKKREEYIRSSLDQAKNDREEAEARLKEFEERLASARAEATAIVEEGRRDAEVVRQRVEKEAREEAEKLIERARREIQIARETAVKELYDLSGTLAAGIATHIVSREVKAEDHERMIDEAIDELSGLTVE